MGKSGKMVLAAFGAAVVGAGVWAAIAYYANIEIGWIAWGIGLLVGLAVAMTSGQPSVHNGIIAVAFTVLAIAAGKYFSVQLAIHNAIGDARWEENYEHEEFLVSLIADDEVLMRMEAGESLNWPGGEAPQTLPEHEADYPRDIWHNAQARWDAMSPDDRQTFRQQKLDEQRAAVAQFREAMTVQGFKESFSLFDLLFFGLAVVTAFQVAGRQSKA